MVVTACNMFKALSMYEDAAECLYIADKRIEAREIIKERLAVKATPRLWCILGDVDEDTAHFHKAWEVSKQRFARAQRSLGHAAFKSKDLAGAVEHYDRALKINPCHG